MQQHDQNTRHDHDDERGHHDRPETHASIANWKTPVIATAISLVATVGILILLTQIVTDVPKPAKDDDAAVLARLKPVGELQLAAAAGPKGQLTGEQVFGQTCKTCHEAGLAGAPKVGDKKAWGKVIAQGLATTVDHAIKGIRAMPPKGGNPDFENVEIERAVVYMANQAGANWKAAPPAATAMSAERSGEEVVKLACAKCHATGERGAPKVGDQKAWGKVIAQGLATAVDHAVKGIRAMPPKGGNPDYEPIEIERAVVFMANQAGANWKAAPPSTAAGSERSGEEVVKLVCAKCHATGERGAPKIGDAAAWRSRASRGLDAVTQAALKGHGGMPARAGMSDLSDV